MTNPVVARRDAALLKVIHMQLDDVEVSLIERTGSFFKGISPEITASIFSSSTHSLVVWCGADKGLSWQAKERANSFCMQAWE